jgi:membrane-associated protein
MDLLTQCWDFLRDFRGFLLQCENGIGPLGLYSLLFAIIFAETGLVVTPILPGDSLLFFLGTRTAVPESPLEFWSLLVLLIAAAIIGDAVNYAIGRFVGPKVFSRESSWFFNKKHLERTQRFYERYGGKTIILARFVPFARTFAPFVAGIGRMEYRKFALFNVLGGVLWVGSLLTVGHLFGQNKFVEDNFSLVILAILLISVAPLGVETILAWRRSKSPKLPPAPLRLSLPTAGEQKAKEVA